MTATANSALQFADADLIGKVASVDTSRVAIDVSNSVLLTRIGIGALLAIRGSTEHEYLIAITERVTRNHREELPDLGEDDEMTELEVVPSDLLWGALIGTFRTVDGEKINTLKRGADSFPQIDRDCFVIEGNNLQRFQRIKQFGNMLDSGKKLADGTLTISSVTDSVKRSAIEGLGSPLQWFTNWSGELHEPPDPPDHWLLNSCFIDTGLREAIKDSLQNGTVSGITGFVGMGGVGKTFTALRVAHDLRANGWLICWVSLLQRTVEDALDLVASNFGLRFMANLSKSEKMAALQAVLPLARRRWPRLLIILDNAEQFPEFQVLLQALPGQTVLVTSRTREQEAVVKYWTIEPLAGELAVELCTRFLDGKMGMEGEWRPTEGDREDLDLLVKLYRGHPLSLRTVLAGFLRFPLKVRRAPRPFQTVLKVLKERGIKGFESEKPQAFSANEPSEHILRHNLNATFQWLYDGLNAPDTGDAERCAHFLLPVCAVVGTASFSLEALSKGIQELTKLANYRATEQNHSSWAGLLKQLQDSPPLLLAAIQKLEDISLLQSVPQEEDCFALHPTVREFAFDLEDPSGISRPSSEMLLRAAMAVISDSGISDTLLDLLPRLKGNRQLVDQAAETLNKRWDSSYHKVNWRHLRLWAEAVLDLVQELGLEDHIIEVKCRLGELLDRMGEPVGLPMIYAALCMYLQKQTKNPFNPPAYEEYDLKAGITLGREIGYGDKRLAWAAAYLLTTKLPPTSRQNVELMADYLRTVIDLDSSIHTWNRILPAMVDMLHTRSSRLLDSAFSDSNTSNAYLLIGRLFAYWAQFTGTSDSENRAARIIRTLGNWLAPIAGKEGAESSPHSPSINPQHRIYLEVHFSGFQLVRGKMALEAFIEEVDRLRKFSHEQGIRFFWAEAAAWRYRGLRSMMAEDWTQAEKDFGLAQTSLKEVANHDEDYATSQDELSLLRSSCALLKGGADEAERIGAIAQSAREREDETIRPFFHFAMACRHWKLGSVMDCLAHASKSLAAFLQQNGQAPVHLSPLLERMCNGAPVAEEETWRSWSLEWDGLPERVRCLADGRTMTLIRPGVHYSESGEHRVTLWPFYIDDTPLSLIELKTMGRSAGVDIVTRKRASSGSLVSRIAGAGWDNLLKSIRKELPTAEEVFAAWLQQEKGLTRECPLSHDAINDALLTEAERQLSANKKESFDWVNLLGKDLSEENSGRRLLKQNRQLTANDHAQLLTRHLAFDWVTCNTTFRRLYEERFLSHFLTAKIMTENEAIRLSSLAATSLSLSEKEKQHIRDAAPTLSLFQCNELTKVFVEEQEKFGELMAEHPKDIQLLIRKAQEEFFGLLATPDIYANIMHKAASIEQWALHFRHPERTESTQWLNRTGDKERCYRLVRPIFIRGDLEGLIPYTDIESN